jgi:tellurite resistance protein
MHKLNSDNHHPDHPIDDFFKVKNYQPQTEEEKHIFEEFSLIKSSLAILIHVANADRAINPEEKNQIIRDIIFQMEQRPYEFARLSEKFGSNEKEIIENMYDQILKDYQNQKLKLDKIVDDICLMYKNNEEKRYYLLRLCYFAALSDNVFDEAEQEAIRKLAQRMDIPSLELDRIEKEVKEEIAKK